MSRGPIRPARGDDLARRGELGSREFAACRDPRAGRVEPQDRRIGVEPPQPGICRAGVRIPRSNAQTAGSDEPTGVSVVVAGDDRHPGGVVQPVRQSAACAARNSAGRAVVVRSPVIRMWSALSCSTRLHQIGTSRQPEPASPDRQAGDAIPASRCSAAERVERVLPEMDVREVDDPQWLSLGGPVSRGRSGPIRRVTTASRSSRPGYRTSCGCRRRCRSRGGRRPRRRRRRPSSGR